MTLQTVPRRSRYPGFRAVLKAVGTGERGRRPLSREEARDAMGAMLAGETTDAQAAAFLLAMRIKGETAEELAGMTEALRERATPLTPPTDRPLVACAPAYDGCCEAPALSLAVGVVAAAAGAGIVLHNGTTLGPKHGTTPSDVLAALGGPARPDAAQSDAMLAAAGVTVVHAAHLLDGWAPLAVLRDEIGLRGPVHSAEKLVDWYGARRFVVGFAHQQYAARITGALGLLGAERAVAVRGPEGSDVLRPARPAAFDADGRVELPEALGDRLAPAPGAEASATLTRAVVAGEADRVTEGAVVLSAGLRLWVAGLAPTVLRGMADARAVVGDRRAAATLDALVAAPSETRPQR